MSCLSRALGVVSIPQPDFSVPRRSAVERHGICEAWLSPFDLWMRSEYQKKGFLQSRIHQIGLSPHRFVGILPTVTFRRICSTIAVKIKQSGLTLAASSSLSLSYFICFDLPIAFGRRYVWQALDGLPQWRHTPMSRFAVQHSLVFNGDLIPLRACAWGNTHTNFTLLFSLSVVGGRTACENS